MITAMYLHQFSGGGRAYRETSYGDFARTARDWGIQQIWFKAFQGGSLARWDTGPLGLSTYDRIFQCFDECAAEGVTAVFWGVPQGNTWEADAALCKAIAARCGGRIHIDQENFADFWNAPAYGTAGWVPFYQTLKDAGLTVDVSAVARFGEPEITPWEEIVENVDTVWAQSYWTDFHEPAVRVVTDDLNTLLARGIPAEKLGSIFPHNGTRPDLDAALEAVRALTVGRVAVWVWDWAGLTPFEFMRDIPPGVEQPDPRQQARDALDEQYRVVHSVLAPLVPRAKQAQAAAALETYDRQLGPIKDALGIV